MEAVNSGMFYVRIRTQPLLLLFLVFWGSSLVCFGRSGRSLSSSEALLALPSVAVACVMHALQDTEGDGRDSHPLH